MPNARLLVIDNERTFTELLKVYFERAGGCQVQTENTATRALATAKAFRPDLILLDLNMPELDGSTLASTFQADDDVKEIPIVFLTAAVSKVEAEHLYNRLGGHTLISKTMPLKELAEWVAQRLTELRRAGPP